MKLYMERLRIEYNSLSKYRTELMGIGIFGVMLIHVLAWMGYEGTAITFPVKILRQVAFLVYTEGFLFLSGFGLFYSLTRNGDVRHYFHRRFLRLWVPYLVLAIPFYLYMDVVRQGDGVTFVLDATTLTNVISHNNGMWYIAFSAILYAVFPFAYRLMFGHEAMKTSPHRVYSALVILVAICIGIDAVCYFGFHSWYDPLRIGYSKMSAFFIGIVFGWLSMKGRSINIWQFIGLVVLFVILHAVKNDFLDAYACILQRIIVMLVFCWIFLNVKKSLLGGVNWLGRYTLEIYILHMFLLNLFALLPLYASHPAIPVAAAILLTLLLCKPYHQVMKKVMEGKPDV